MGKRDLEIVAATGNKNKLREILLSAKNCGVDVLCPYELMKQKSLGAFPNPEETGKSYRENALIKAKAFLKWSSADAALGDDSGLEVMALGNVPGINSARYGGEGLSDLDRINLLLENYNKKREEMPGFKISSKAVFKCSLALVFRDGRVMYEESELFGELLMKPRGSRGFGYDPIVYVNSIGKTLAEADFSVILDKGFRPNAVKNLFSKFKGL